MVLKTVTSNDKAVALRKEEAAWKILCCSIWIHSLVELFVVRVVLKKGLDK